MRQNFPQIGKVLNINSVPYIIPHSRTQANSYTNPLANYTLNRLHVTSVQWSHAPPPMTQETHRLQLNELWSTSHMKLSWAHEISRENASIFLLPTEDSWMSRTLPSSRSPFKLESRLPDQGETLLEYMCSIWATGVTESNPRGEVLQHSRTSAPHSSWPSPQSVRCAGPSLTYMLFIVSGPHMWMRNLKTAGHNLIKCTIE